MYTFCVSFKVEWHCIYLAIRVIEWYVLKYTLERVANTEWQETQLVKYSNDRVTH